MLLNPVPLSGGSVWTSIHTHIQRWSLHYLGLDIPSAQWLIGEPLQQTHSGGFTARPWGWWLPWDSPWEVLGLFLCLCSWGFPTYHPASVLLVFVERGLLMGSSISSDGHGNSRVRLLFRFPFAIVPPCSCVCVLWSLLHVTEHQSLLKE